MSRILRACAKINLYLDITGRREDGYHLLETVMQSISLYDTVEIGFAAGDDILLHCDAPNIPSDERNIAYKAVRRYLDEAGISACVMIDIKKRIPSGAGMGGGSADAAAVLSEMERHFGKLGNERLMSLAAEIGADVPFCVAGGTRICRGIGEEMSEILPVKDKWYLVVMPDFTCPTGAAFARYDNSPLPLRNSLSEFVSSLETGAFADRMYNTFEVLYSDSRIERIKNDLLSAGAEGALLTGSGAAVFGVFSDEATAAQAAERFKEYFTSVCRPTEKSIIIE